jgi:multidrug resistance efflux pump
MAEHQSVFSERHDESNTHHSKTDYYQSWLDNHQHLISGMRSAVLYLPIESGLLAIASYQSDHGSFVSLTETAEKNFDAQQPQVSTLSYTPAADSDSGEYFGLYYPLYDDKSTLIAFTAIALEAKHQAELTQAITVLQWSAASLEVVEYQQRSQQLDTAQAHTIEKVDLLARVLSEQSYDSAAVRLVTELAVLYHCDRVSLGEYKNKRSILKHLSHSAQFGKKMNLVRAIEKTMDECIDQGRIIRYTGIANADNSDIVIAHNALSVEQGDIAVMSIPIYLNGKVHGAIVLESLPDSPWTQQQAETCQSIVSLIVPTLEDKRKNDRSWLRKTADLLGTQLGRLIGPNYLGRKLFVVAAIVVAYLLSTVHSEYKLSAPAQIESAIQRAVVAPYDGYINDALARAGDHVRQDDVLVLMDDKDLRLEKLKWLSEQGKLNRQYLEAVAVRNRAKINIINAQQQQVTAQLELVNSQLERGQLTAPYNGIITHGDLSQRLGSAVTKGELLLEVAPLNSYRIQLKVKESRIADLAVDQKGFLYLSALPEQAFEFSVSKITPLTETAEGSTYFIVEGELLAKYEQLQSGMEGIGKVSIDERLWFHIWTRELREWGQLQIWSWWG